MQARDNNQPYSEWDKYPAGIADTLDSARNTARARRPDVARAWKLSGGIRDLQTRIRNIGSRWFWRLERKSEN